MLHAELWHILCLPVAHCKIAELQKKVLRQFGQLKVFSRGFMNVIIFSLRNATIYIYSRIAFSGHICQKNGEGDSSPKTYDACFFAF
jgi:hypothetical protein